MKSKKTYKAGDKFGKWKLVEKIGSGGNGQVWSAADNQNNRKAIKLLKNVYKKSYGRFRDEIKAVISNHDIQGILPIIDSYLPKNISNEKPYYVMPIAVPLQEHVDKKSTSQIIKLMINLADSLAKLHQRKVFHRDIKPANLFIYDHKPCFGDFGLVDFPNKKEITREKESVGPKWTIAPEMKRNAHNADGEKADSYSFAKTLWILLTKQQLSFEGEYHINSVVSIENYLKDIYAKPLDDLFSQCTDNDPTKRPNLKEVSNFLRQWEVLNTDYQKRNKAEWKEIQEILFPTSMPARVVWLKIEDIISVLNLLSKNSNLNHMFLPGGGGLDLSQVKKSSEESCIEINANGLIYIVKPERLMFESFNVDFQWNYFRLETSQLKPISNDKSVKFNEEPLTEISPGIYTDYDCYEYNNFNGNTLPDTARPVVRILKGAFVLFSKTSIYNKVSSTYDGRHNKVTSEKFREYIEKSAINHYQQNNPPTNSSITPVRYVKDSHIETGRKLTEKEVSFLKKIIAMANKISKGDDQLKKKYGINEFYIDLSFDSKYEYIRD
ncbi:MAG: hypothetical protein D3920_14095, partial [Candidatus Electrothrix sp. AW2]|nr:hypothetical protein [Candidatus Electrothrix gigas]